MPDDLEGLNIMGEGRYEPSAAARGIASSAFDQYQAFLQAGFAEWEALELVKHLITTSVIMNQNKEEDE